MQITCCSETINILLCGLSFPWGQERPGFPKSSTFYKQEFVLKLKSPFLLIHICKVFLLLTRVCERKFLTS